MKKIFTLISVALVAMSANAQTQTYKYCVPADFVLNEYHKIIEAKNEAGELMGTIELLSSPNKNELFKELTDEDGNKILDDEGKPQFDETQPQDAWKMIVNGPDHNRSLGLWEEGFDYCIQGKGNPVMSQNEGWEETDNGWSYRVTDAVYWTPGCGELPKQGEYVKVTPTADGAITIGTFINKGGGVNGTGHQLYIIDESTKDAGYQVLGADQVVIRGTFNNNTVIPNERVRTYDEATQTWSDVVDENGENVLNYPFGSELPLTLTLSDDYSLFMYTSYDGTVKRFDNVFLGLVSFNVKKDVTYWMLNPTSQFGFYGFKLEVGGSINGIDAVQADRNVSAPMYNLAGQKVAEGYKGMVIQNGRKVVMK